MGFRPFYGWAKRGDGGVYAVALQANVQIIDATYVTEMANTPLAQRGFYDRVARARRGAFTAEFITPEELEMRNGMSVDRILEGRRGIRLARDRLGRPVVLGRGGCGMTILLDGQFISTLEQVVVGDAPQSFTPSAKDQGAEKYPSITEIIRGSEVMAVEIYLSTANAPAELVRVSGRGSCGIVAFWTGGRH